MRRGGENKMGESKDETGESGMEKVVLGVSERRV